MGLTLALLALALALAPICRTVRSPLAAYTEKNAFILYLFDVGILGAMQDLDASVLYQYDFGQFKGFLAENAVLNKLMSGGIEPICTRREGSSEIEFLTSSRENPVPLEVSLLLRSRIRPRIRRLRLMVL